MKLNTFEINENTLHEKFREKNIAFFKLIDSGKYESILYVYDSNNEINDTSKDIISIITLKNGKPMSMPIDVFMSAINVKGLNRETVVMKVKNIISVNEIKVISKKDFSRSIRYERVLKKTKDFWKKFNGIESISSLIYVLQNNGIIRLPQGELRMQDSFFYLKTYNHERIVTPQEAISYMTCYLNKKSNELDSNTMEFLIERYAN
jgi:hypothetical protein